MYAGVPLRLLSFGSPAPWRIARPKSVAFKGASSSSDRKRKLSGLTSR